MTVVLVTGGAGYIGSHVCKALAADGYTPVSFDNLSRGHRWAVQWGPLEIGDLRDADAIAETIRRHQPQAVIHLAALSSPGASMQDPGPYYHVNLGGGLNLLTGMQAQGVRRIVHSSSSAVYGAARRMPVTEDSPCAPMSTYGFSKLAFENILADFRRAHGFAAVNLRYFNAAGADPEAQIGECHEPEEHLIPRVLAAARDGSLVTLNGDDYPTADGTCVRDYVHVSDLAQAHVLALRAMLADRPCAPAYNLGSGTGFSLREIVNCAQDMTGLPVQTEIGPRRAGDPPETRADASLARAELGWDPVNTQIDIILRTAWAWMQRLPDIKEPAST